MPCNQKPPSIYGEDMLNQKSTDILSTLAMVLIVLFMGFFLWYELIFKSAKLDNNGLLTIPHQFYLTHNGTGRAVNYTLKITAAGYEVGEIEFTYSQAFNFYKQAYLMYLNVHKTPIYIGDEQVGTLTLKSGFDPVVHILNGGVVPYVNKE